MAVSGGYSPQEAVLLMTLSGFTYIDRTPLPGEKVRAQQARMRRDIDAALAASAYPDWQVVWGPGLNDDRSNMMYVAGNQTNGQCALAIRGTDLTFFMDWIQDFAAVLGLVPFRYGMSPGAGNDIKIAAGTEIGLDQLVQMTGATPSGAQLDVATFLKQRGAPEVFVTGHSLGGCLASVAAPWLAHELSSANTLKVYTFAAPSAGNAAFAGYYNRLFMDAGGQSTAFRVYNTLDVIPNAWASLLAIDRYYVPAPPSPMDVQAIVGITAGSVGANYSQVGTAAQHSAVSLPGHVVSPPSGPMPLDPFGDSLFFNEADQQHAVTMYLSLLGAPPTRPAVAKLRGLVRSTALRAAP